MGGLPSLVALLRSPHAQLRKGAAEVLAAACQCNEPVQREFLDAGALPLLLGMLQDDQPACRCLLHSSGPLRSSPVGLCCALGDRPCQTVARLCGPDAHAAAAAGALQHRTLDLGLKPHQTRPSAEPASAGQRRCWACRACCGTAGPARKPSLRLGVWMP